MQPISAKTLECGVTQTEYVMNAEGQQITIDWNKYIQRVKKEKNKILLKLLRSLENPVLDYPPGMMASIYITIFKDGTISTRLLKDDCFECRRSVMEGLAWTKLQYSKVLEFPKYTEYDRIELISNIGSKDMARGKKDDDFGTEEVQISQ